MANQKRPMWPPAGSAVDFVAIYGLVGGAAAYLRIAETDNNEADKVANIGFGVLTALKALDAKQRGTLLKVAGNLHDVILEKEQAASERSPGSSRDATSTTTQSFPIQCDPKKMSGEPTIGAKRLPVEFLFRYGVDDFQRNYPHVTDEEIDAVIAATVDLLKSHWRQCGTKEHLSTKGGVEHG